MAVEQSQEGGMSRVTQDKGIQDGEGWLRLELDHDVRVTTPFIIRKPWKAGQTMVDLSNALCPVTHELIIVDC
jgi:hypothetical protein